ncbi:glycosyltransferase family 2 protein [Gracilibacillus sp. S3-1-1]|uniref:Glycosyltransferase family 2 protein n=1 Tax=Gracilibacillus pellucidus TaxID=3095368 RepID=A0ACC6M3S3_9BACI|nr:glycosyltransferase family 2 protein [Gracilibacillus sp. S3-1-1]MDX8045610.1 glycosyltransferase family 2 protein [Gracilibacillus sp. S3-1-1]
MILKITLVLFVFFIFFQFVYILYPLYAVKEKEKIKKLGNEKGVSIIIPAYNEEKVILNCLEGIRQLDYHNYEALFVNDGSTDQTLDVLHTHLDLQVTSTKLPTGKIPHEEVKEIYQSNLYPNIYVIDKKNGGKADALNAGTEYVAKEIVVTLDADSIMDSMSLHAINVSFENKEIVAAGGLVQIQQGYTGDLQKPNPIFSIKGLIRHQVLQYMTAFYLHKLTQAKLNSITVIAGAFGAFRKKALFDVDGYRRTVGEDMDITLKVHRLIKTNKNYKNNRLTFIPQAICYTECPENFRELYNQRIRWQKAFVDCIFHFRKSFFRKLGFSPSFFLLFDSLFFGTINAYPTILIPVTLLFNQDNYIVAAGLFSVATFLAIYQGIVTLVVSRRFGIIYSKKQLPRVLFFIPLEAISYRLLGLLFVTTGTLLYFKNKNSWYVSKRVGTKEQALLLEKKAV